LLPFKDNGFEATFHIGGINYFGDKKAESIWKATDWVVEFRKPA
jgi:hypothetical protein